MDDILPPKKPVPPPQPKSSVTPNPSGAPELMDNSGVTSDIDLSSQLDKPVGQMADASQAESEDPLVDDVARADADAALEKLDAEADKAVVMKPKLRERLKTAIQNWWDNPKKRWPTLVVLVLIAVIFILPVTRYKLLGLVIKKNVQITVVDSKTNTPVSSAKVDINGRSGLTNAKGMATVRVSLGSQSATISKQYYTVKQATVMVGFRTPRQQVQLDATGRQVPITVVNRITGKPVANAQIAVAKTQAKTDTAGKATIVLPTEASKLDATVSGAGYETAKLPVSVTADVVASNTLSLTPAGRVYFLSNSSGRLDVVKTNLDGSDRQTVLAGTGSEDQRNTSLLASRDWKYLALLSRRSGSSASLYLIDTTNNDKVTTIDSGSADFNLVGWDGDTFVYQVTRLNIQNWQPGQISLKSYDATAAKLYQLDQTTASGTGSADFVAQNLFSPYITGTSVVYGLGWSASANNYGQLTDKQATLMSVNADGSGRKTVKSFSPPADTPISYLGFDIRAYEPGGLYIQFTSGATTNLYKYENGNLSTTTDVTADSFYETAYPTYLQSPSGKATFWSEPRDGKNTLFVGSSDGENGKQIMNLSDYTPYGWFTDSYLLVSKNGSELYILPSDGSKPPQKLSDYYKPAQTYFGYGGGYGGL